MFKLPSWSRASGASGSYLQMLDMKALLNKTSAHVTWSYRSAATHAKQLQQAAPPFPVNPELVLVHAGRQVGSDRPWLPLPVCALEWLQTLPLVVGALDVDFLRDRQAVFCISCNKCSGPHRGQMLLQTQRLHLIRTWPECLHTMVVFTKLLSGGTMGNSAASAIARPDSRRSKDAKDPRGLTCGDCARRASLVSIAGIWNPVSTVGCLRQDGK